MFCQLLYQSFLEELFAEHWPSHNRSGGSLVLKGLQKKIPNHREIPAPLRVLVLRPKGAIAPCYGANQNCGKLKS